MQFPANDPGRGAPRELNLQQMANQFMAGMQRHFDMLAFNLACREGASESRYNSLVAGAGLMPVAQLHQNFEQMQAHARDLLLRQVVNDALNLTVTVLHNCHLFLAIIKVQAQQGKVSPENQKLVQAAQNAFVQAPLDEKFNQLEANYKILCELEDSITSLAFCIQAFAQNHGVVGPTQLEGSDALTIELKCAPAGIPLQQPLQPGIVSSRSIAFGEDQPITFTDKDLQDILLTVAVFAQQLFTAVARFAQDSQAQA